MIDLQVVKHFAKIELCRRSFADYVEYIHNGYYRHAAHTLLICERLQELVEEGKKRIMVFMPPRHGKSMTVTETFPSYYLGRNPDKRVIISAYSDDLAIDFSRRNRQKVEEYGREIFGVKVAKDKAAVKAWDIAEHRGGLVAAGIGGTITGKGADVLLIDDPVKNDAEAQSITYRDRVYNEYKSTLLTRLQAGGSVILIMTRWHEDDLAGRLLAESKEWNVISLPAECDSEDDLLRRQIGDPLWADGGYDKAWIAESKIALGSRVWTSLYQQRPSVEKGNIFKRDWFKRYSKLPEHIDYWTQSWDFTFKDSSSNDYVCGGVWAKSGANHYLVYRIKERIDFVKSLEAIQRVTALYPQAAAKLVEEKANGAAIISMLRSKLPGIIPINPTASKEGRANSVTPFFEAGNVYIPSDAVWAEDYINELLSFPNGAHDDQVDMTSQYLARYIAAAHRSIALIS